MARAAAGITEVIGTELVYRPLDRSTTSSSEAALFKMFVVPIALAGVLGALLSPNAGLVGLLGSAAFLEIQRRKRKSPPGVRIKVESGVVEARSPTGKELGRFTLDELLDVALDIKTIERVQEGSALVPATRFIESRVGPELDTGRVVLVGLAGGARKTVPLTPEYLAHMDASEALGKIRVFLRKQGWVPLDERDEAPPSSQIA